MYREKRRGAERTGQDRRDEEVGCWLCCLVKLVGYLLLFVFMERGREEGGKKGRK